MPYVNIRIAGTLSHEQMKKIAAEVTGTLERVVLKPKSSIYISFDEVPREYWAVGGELLGKKE